MIILLVVFFVLDWLRDGLEDTLPHILLLGMVLVGFTAYRIWKNKLFLADFESDSENVRIRYYNGNTEKTEKSQIRNIEVQLKNTASQSGFDCELVLRINNKKIIVDDTFDWTLSEMKHLFEYIKIFKDEPFTDKDNFNVSKMEEKIKKLNSLKNQSH